MKSNRRTFLGSLFGTAGSLGLASLATGLPAALLANPRLALADPPLTCADPSAAQFLLLSTSGLGDPVNANAPGSYVPGVVHPTDASMAATTMMVGSQAVTGAQVWSTLPSSVLAQACFFHHATYTNSHPNEFKVLQLMGSTANGESIPSIYAKSLAPCLGTVQTPPVVLSGNGNGVVFFEGRPLPAITPTALRDTLAPHTGALASLQSLRDTHLDNINAVLRQGATPAQRNYVDALVTSRGQARAVAAQVPATLSSIRDDGPVGQTAAALVLFQLKLTPVVVTYIPFGGDNHSDPDFMAAEVPQTQSGVAQIGATMAAIAGARANLTHDVAFAMLNVFGRTLSSQGTTGRGHWANHHVGLVISSRTRGGVVGGLVPGSGDFVATSIDSTTGQSNGDIPAMETLQAYAKTLGRTVGVPESVLDAQIMGGQPVVSALAAT